MTGGGTVKVSLTIPVEIIDQADMLATHFGRSRSSVISDVLAASFPRSVAELIPILSDKQGHTPGPRRRTQPEAPIAVLHEALFIPRKGRPRKDGLRFGHGGCICGWRSVALGSEKEARRNADSHVRKMLTA